MIDESFKKREIEKYRRARLPPNKCLAFGLVPPTGMVALVACSQSSIGLWAASILRSVFGLVLWFAALTSWAPLALQVLVVMTVMAALALPAVGVSRFEAILSWLCRQSPAFVQAWSATAMVLGAFLPWSVAA